MTDLEEGARFIYQKLERDVVQLPVDLTTASIAASLRRLADAPSPYTPDYTQSLTSIAGQIQSLTNALNALIGTLNYNIETAMRVHVENGHKLTTLIELASRPPMMVDPGDIRIGDLTTGAKPD